MGGACVGGCGCVCEQMWVYGAHSWVCGRWYVNVLHTSYILSIIILCACDYLTRRTHRMVICPVYICM